MQVAKENNCALSFKNTVYRNENYAKTQIVLHRSQLFGRNPSMDVARIFFGGNTFRKVFKKFLKKIAKKALF